MKEIGGYFGTEHLASGVQSVLHSDGIFVNSGHNAFSLILQSLLNIKHIYIPRYVCHIIPDTLRELHISFSYYQINFNLEISVFPELQDGEYILVINYFGVKDQYINKLIGDYGGRLIVDNVQAFFYNMTPSINSFYSVRKFFGVPDGGIAYSSVPQRSLISDSNPVVFNSHQIKRDTMGAEAGFREYRNNE